MQLTEKKLSKKLSNYKEICAFMKRVFPKEELMPMWLIRLLTKKKKHDFSVFYDEEVFVGILYTIESDEEVFVFYIAVNDSIQSKGYGSALIKNLFAKYEGKTVSLFIETMDDKSAPNYEQRVKRLAFYERNGFFQTGISAGTKTPFIDILSTSQNYSAENAKKLLRGMPMKLFLPSV